MKVSNNLSELKNQLFEMKRAKKKNPIWKLTDSQVEYVEKLGFKVTGYLYCIKTRTFPNVKELNCLLKDIHYTRQKQRKKVIYRTLSEKQKRLLDEHEVYSDVYKYEIHLRQYDGK